jgi:hypothetical protein
VTTSDLTVSKALVSDAAGKIANAATTAVELGYLVGTTSSIQTQLGAKQATITGAASTVTTSDLGVSKALVSDAAGKITDAATTAVELGYLVGTTSSIQSQLGAKQATITGAASTVTTSDLTISKALVSDAAGKIANAATTAVELGYLVGTTSSIQTQLGAKQATITGAASTVTTSDLGVSKALVSDAAGKISNAATTAVELGYLSGLASSAQTQIDSKADTIAPSFTGLVTITGNTTTSGVLNMGSRVQNCLICLFGNTLDPASTAHYGFGVNSNTLRYQVTTATAAHSFYGATTLFGHINSGGFESQAWGTAALPAYSFVTDPNSGIWLPAADTLAVSTGGVERIRVNATGLVGIGTVAPETTLHIAGALTTESINESTTSLSGATGVVVHDWNLGSIFYHTSPAANFTVNVTNLAAVEGRTTSVTLVIVQGATGRMATAVQIAGVAQTIRWEGGFVPSGTSSKWNIVTFSFIRAASAWTVFGQSVVFG